VCQSLDIAVTSRPRQYIHIWTAVPLFHSDSIVDRTILWLFVFVRTRSSALVKGGHATCCLEILSAAAQLYEKSHFKRLALSA